MLSIISTDNHLRKHGNFIPVTSNLSEQEETPHANCSYTRFSMKFIGNKLICDGNSVLYAFKISFLMSWHSFILTFFSVILSLWLLYSILIDKKKKTDEILTLMLYKCYKLSYFAVSKIKLMQFNVIILFLSFSCVVKLTSSGIESVRVSSCYENIINWSHINLHIISYYKIL